MATTEEARAVRDAKLDALHEQLTGAVESLVSGKDWRQSLEFAVRFRVRSFNNTLLIFVQHQAAFEADLVPEPVPSYVAGFTQWQVLGRQVGKGQSGYMILAPVTGRFASATPKVEKSWHRISLFEKPKPGEAVRSLMVGVRPAYVWDVSQTAGDTIPASPSPRMIEGEAPEGLWDGIAAHVGAQGFSVMRVPHEATIHGANGLTDFRARTVAVRETFPGQGLTLSGTFPRANSLTDVPPAAVSSW